jgi:hypothetical protein
MANLRSRLWMTWVMALLGVVLAVVAGCAPGLGGATVANPPAAQAQGSNPVDALEARHGIRITRLALINFGAIVDFQYLVTDADKANEWMHEAALVPDLVDEDSGARMGRPPFHEMNTMQLEVGRTYHKLLPNAGNAIKPGDGVSVLIGDLRVGPMAAE